MRVARWVWRGDVARALLDQVDTNHAGAMILESSTKSCSGVCGDFMSRTQHPKASPWSLAFQRRDF